MHLVGIAQSLGLFLMVCLAIGGFLTLAMTALARLEASVVPLRHAPNQSRSRAAHPSGGPTRGSGATTRGCSYPPPSGR